MPKLGLDYGTWLESQPSAQNIKTYPGIPAYSVSPKNITAYVNASSPWDLWRKPDDSPFYMDYPTSAVNISPPWHERKPKNKAIMFSSGEDIKRGLYQAEPRDMQGIYEHEAAHWTDPRINPYRMWSFPNHGLTTYGGLSGGLLQREFPAMVAEERYYNSKR